MQTPSISENVHKPLPELGARCTEVISDTLRGYSGISVLGASMPLLLGVVGHEGSTLLVVLNGLRLLRYRAGALK